MPKTLDFLLSPKCAIKIFRAKASVGGGTSVSMMTFGASGDMLNRFAFAEGRSNVNSGELVISTKVPDAAASKGAKAAADDEDDEAETVEAAPAKDGKDEADAGPSDGEKADGEKADDKKADDKKDQDDEDI